MAATKAPHDLTEETFGKALVTSLTSEVKRALQSDSPKDPMVVREEYRKNLSTFLQVTRVLDRFITPGNEGLATMHERLIATLTEFVTKTQQTIFLPQNRRLFQLLADTFIPTCLCDVFAHNSHHPDIGEALFAVPARLPHLYQDVRALSGESKQTRISLGVSQVMDYFMALESAMPPTQDIFAPLDPQGFPHVMIIRESLLHKNKASLGEIIFLRTGMMPMAPPQEIKDLSRLTEQPTWPERNTLIKCGRQFFQTEVVTLASL